MIIQLPPTGTGQDRSSPVRSVRTTLAQLCEEDRRHDDTRPAPIATGFDLLDRVLDGGMRPHDLVLLGGAPGVGKTVAALQMARHAALHGHTALFLSYEHEERVMLGRLLVLELGEAATPTNVPDVDRLRGEVLAATAGFRSLETLIANEPLVAAAVRTIDGYADRLLLVRGSGQRTDLAAIEAMIAGSPLAEGGVLFVDYLQKVALEPAPELEAEKVTRVAEGLKDLALTYDVTVVAMVAADQQGLRADRVRLHHLRGSSALAYECDAAIMLNEKHLAVSHDHLAYDPVRAESFKHLVVFAVEKNRGGPAMVDLEFRKDFLHYRFQTRGAFMAERSVDDRLGRA